MFTCKNKEEIEKEISETNKLRIWRIWERGRKKVSNKKFFWGKQYHVLDLFPFKNREGIEEEISETTKKAVRKKQRKRKIVDSDQDSMTSSDDKNTKRKNNEESNSEEKGIVSNSKAEETGKKCSLMKHMIENYTGIFQT